MSSEFRIEVIEHNTTRSYYDDGSVVEDGHDCHSYFDTMEEVIEFLVKEVQVGVVGLTRLGDDNAEYWGEYGRVKREDFVESVEIIPLFNGIPTMTYSEFEEKYLVGEDDV